MREMNFEELVNDRWGRIQPGIFDFTPDETRASTFLIEEVNQDGVVVLANMNSRIPIPRSAFEAAIHILVENNSTEENPMRIGSSNGNENSLELCLGTKAESGGTRVITYIAPILLRMDIVDIGHNRPNTIWLNTDLTES